MYLKWQVLILNAQNNEKSVEFIPFNEFAFVVHNCYRVSWILHLNKIYRQSVSHRCDNADNSRVLLRLGCLTRSIVTIMGYRSLMTKPFHIDFSQCHFVLLTLECEDCVCQCAAANKFQCSKLEIDITRRDCCKPIHRSRTRRCYYGSHDLFELSLYLIDHDWNVPIYLKIYKSIYRRFYEQKCNILNHLCWHKNISLNSHQS